MAKLPQILKKELIARSRLFGVEELHLRFSNGVERVYERLRNPPVQAVLVIPVLDNDTILLIREYGAGTESYELGLPKGALEPDETLGQGANRELMEEAGYGARDITVLKRLTLSPSYMGHYLTVVLAENLYPARLEGDEPEPIEVVPMRLSEIDDWVWRDDFTEARSIAALYLARDLLARREAVVEGEVQ
jgi:ADP-ribose diphosphatase